MIFIVTIIIIIKLPTIIQNNYYNNFIDCFKKEIVNYLNLEMKIIQEVNHYMD